MTMILASRCSTATRIAVDELARRQFDRIDLLQRDVAGIHVRRQVHIQPSQRDSSVCGLSSNRNRAAC